jgi:hypothetical protein
MYLLDASVRCSRTCNKIFMWCLVIFCVAALFNTSTNLENDVGGYRLHSNVNGTMIYIACKYNNDLRIVLTTSDYIAANIASRDSRHTNRGYRKQTKARINECRVGIVE